MPKIKTHSGLKKRIKITGSGKLQKRHAAISHLQSKSRRIRKQGKKKQTDVATSDRRKIKKLI